MLGERRVPAGSIHHLAAGALLLEADLGALEGDVSLDDITGGGRPAELRPDRFLGVIATASDAHGLGADELPGVRMTMDAFDHGDESIVIAAPAESIVIAAPAESVDVTDAFRDLAESAPLTPGSDFATT
jgi:hypothetical protein